MGVAYLGIGQLGGELSVVLHTRGSHLREFRGHIMKPEGRGCPHHQSKQLPQSPHSKQSVGGLAKKSILSTNPPPGSFQLNYCNVSS